MYKVLHIMGCSDVGGISTVVLNYYKNIDHSKIHFDIALKTNGVIGRNGKALEAMGANVYFLPLKSKDVKNYVNTLKRIFIENRYDAVHVHEGTSAFVALRIAKQCGVPQRIAHSHTTSPDGSMKAFLRRKAGQILNFIYATDVIGCGRLAGERVFGKNVMKSSKGMVLPNAVDTTVFYYNPSLRTEIRKEMGIDNKFVVGMVGRLAHQKNNPFALELIEQVHQVIPNSVLLVAGDGEEREQLEQTISEKGMNDYVTLLGSRNDVPSLYNAFDVFLMPSFYEGFPVAAVEAMACGLPVLLSDTITDELSFGEKVFYLPLDRQDEWVNTLQKCTMDTGREQRQLEIINNGLDIKGTVGKLESLYLKHEQKEQ